MRTFLKLAAAATVGLAACGGNVVLDTGGTGNSAGGGGVGGSSTTPTCDVLVAAVEACCQNPPPSIANVCPDLVSAAQAARMEAAKLGVDCPPGAFTCPKM